ncbi:MAG: hypothetical protein ABI878_07400 [Acidobacteriota bacterium]
MLSLDDPQWKKFKGGYRLPYDVSIPLRKLEAGENVWNEFWNELHHQGYVDEASYAAVPHLIRIANSSPRRDWNLYSLVAIIEVERHRRSNPPVPAWLQPDYDSAWRKLGELALIDLKSTQDELIIRSTLAVFAIWRGAIKLGALLIDLDLSEIDELAEERLMWSELYESK